MLVEWCWALQRCRFPDGHVCGAHVVCRQGAGADPLPAQAAFAVAMACDHAQQAAACPLASALASSVNCFGIFCERWLNQLEMRLAMDVWRWTGVDCLLHCSVDLPDASAVRRQTSPHSNAVCLQAMRLPVFQERIAFAPAVALLWLVFVSLPITSQAMCLCGKDAMPSTNSNFNSASFGGDREGPGCDQAGSSAMSPRALWASLTLLQAAAGVLVWHANGGTLFSGPLVTFVVHKVRWSCTADCNQSTVPNQLCWFWYRHLMSERDQHVAVVPVPPARACGCLSQLSWAYLYWHIRPNVC
jgi:hypothetical protein